MMKSILLSLLWILACTDAQPAQTETTSAATNTDPTSCFEKYSGKLDEMMTREDILSVHSFDIDEAEFNYPRAIPDAYQSYIYEWESERTTMVKIGGYETSIPNPYRIGLGNLSFYSEKIKDPLAYFKNAHRTPTEEEKEFMREEMQKKMEEEGMSTSQKNTGTKLSDTIADKIQFETIEGVADAAAWDFMDNALVVLAGRAKFKVIVDISNDVQENQAVAIKLARRILEKC